jgi:hypothetical protein
VRLRRADDQELGLLLEALGSPQPNPAAGPADGNVTGQLKVLVTALRGRCPQVRRYMAEPGQ